MEAKEQEKVKDFGRNFIYEPYVIVKCSDGEVKATLHQAIITDPVKAMEAAKRMSEDMEKIGMVTEIGITEEELPF